jgi:type III pantothenate kinase
MERVMYIDMGNSCLKWASASKQGLGPMMRRSYSVDSLPALLLEVWDELTPPVRVVAANVAGDRVAAVLMQWVHDRWGTSIEFVHTTAKACGVHNGYTQPETLGVDRWLALIAAHRLLTGTACIIDCGTAITCDVIGGDGEHLGGQIAPGLYAMKSALVANTQSIRQGEASEELGLLAGDTASALERGCLWAAIAYLDRIIVEINEWLKVPMQVIVTGGDAPKLLPYLGEHFASRQWRHEPDWVLRGLQILASEKA